MGYQGGQGHDGHVHVLGIVEVMVREIGHHWAEAGLGNTSARQESLSAHCQSVCSFRSQLASL